MSVEAAAEAYGIDPRGLVPVASVYRDAAAYRAGVVLLKPYRYTEQQLYYATTALEHLERHGFKLAPRLIWTRNGQPYLRAGRSLWYATTWIPGRAPRFPRELCPAAQSLAAFHSAAQGHFMPWAPSRSWRVRWSNLLKDLREFAERAEAGSTGFDRGYARAAPRLIAIAGEAVDALDACGYDQVEADLRQRRGFCHRDCTAANLVVGESTGHVCLVDPDTWGAELRLHDLVRLLSSGAGSDPVVALRALATYEGLAAPLDPRERRLLPAALRLPREFWWAGVCRYRRPAAGVDPERVLLGAITGAPGREAWVAALGRAL